MLRAAYLGSPASLPEALGDLGDLGVTQRGAVPTGTAPRWVPLYYVQRKGPADQVRRQAQRKKKKKLYFKGVLK
ncbi:jg14354 [Pararge aegeria aegeria]|uniref:Jg14354 protein n=1 Tax=Pararge aegeria aegeria TaxID=348720 RepID=A0A8S4RA03_9NEOP|nr:jg14354 [Pararge aegeria aegeria]